MFFNQIYPGMICVLEFMMWKVKDLSSIHEKIYINFKSFVSLLDWLHTLHASFALLNYSLRRVPFVCCLYFLVSLVLFQSQLRAHVLLHRIALELRQLFLFLLTQLLSCNNWCSNSIHRFYAHKMEYTNKCITIVSMWIYMFYFYARMFFNI